MSKWTDLTKKYPAFKDTAEDVYQAVKERLISEGMVLRQDVVVSVPAPVAPTPITPVPEPETEFPKGLIWLHTNVSKWPVTAKLNVKLFSTDIQLNYDKAKTWPTALMNGTPVCANPWVIFEKEQVSGQWYAATFEWFKSGQVQKPRATVAGDHIKCPMIYLADPCLRQPPHHLCRPPLFRFKKAEIPRDWRPSKGQKLGFMVSGLARGGLKNVAERSNVVWVEW